jgi:hypothetical protein
MGDPAGLERSRLASRAPQMAVRGLAAVFKQIAYWAPVVLAMAFLAHVAHKSLTPALREKARLELREAEMQGREQRQLDQQQGLETELEALDDPIYQERVRRMEQQTESVPLKVTSPVPYSEGAGG